MKVQFLRPTYVEELPDKLEEGVLYICEEFDLTAHKCCCGCGEDVYNKLGPAKWQLIKVSNGSVSLEPSIGNWKYACRSHYWIRNNRVMNAGPMSAATIEAVKQRDRRDRDAHIARVNAQQGLWERGRALIVRALRWLKGP